MRSGDGPPWVKLIGIDSGDSPEFFISGEKIQNTQVWEAESSGDRAM